MAQAQVKDLERRETRIEEAERNSYYIRGTEFAAIRDGKLWQARHNCTFEEYGEQRWELARSQVFHLMAAAAFAEKVHNCGLALPSRESHIRPLLTRLEHDDDRLAVWRDVLATINGGRIKASDVEDAVSRFLAVRNKQFVTLDEWAGNVGGQSPCCSQPRRQIDAE